MSDTPLERYTSKKMLCTRFRTVLSDARKNKGEWKSVITRPWGTESLWETYERYQMLTEVNLLRLDRDKEPVGEQEILHAEGLALGHVDYAEKFSLYCAELVLDRE